MAKISDDLVGVVTTYNAAGGPVVLKAGDDVPAGVEVGEHVLATTKRAASTKTEK